MRHRIQPNSSILVRVYRCYDDHCTVLFTCKLYSCYLYTRYSWQVCATLLVYCNSEWECVRVCVCMCVCVQYVKEAAIESFLARRWLAVTWLNSSTMESTTWCLICRVALASCLLITNSATNQVKRPARSIPITYWPQAPRPAGLQAFTAACGHRLQHDVVKPTVLRT